MFRHKPQSKNNNFRRSYGGGHDSYICNVRADGVNLVGREQRGGGFSFKAAGNRGSPRSVARHRRNSRRLADAQPRARLFIFLPRVQFVSSFGVAVGHKVWALSAARAIFGAVRSGVQSAVCMFGRIASILRPRALGYRARYFNRLHRHSFVRWRLRGRSAPFMADKKTRAKKWLTFRRARNIIIKSQDSRAANFICLCRYGGIGRRAGLRILWATVQVQLLLSAPTYSGGQSRCYMLVSYISLRHNRVCSCFMCRLK